MATETPEAPTAGLETAAAAPEVKPKLHGRAFYESIGSPKFILAPMVDQSEFVSISHERADSKRSTIADLDARARRPGECSVDPSSHPRSNRTF